MCPRLSAQLGDYPSCLAGDIGKGQHRQGCQIQPAMGGGDVLAPGDMADDEEEEHEECPHAHHDAEGVEVDGDIGHQFGSVLDISITEIWHVLLQLGSQTVQSGVGGVGSLQPAVGGNC